MKRLVILLSLSLLFLVGCNEKDNLETENNQEVNESQSGEENNNVQQENKSTKLYDDKEYVYAFESIENAKIEIPYVNINSDDAAKLNGELNNILNKIKEQREDEDFSLKSELYDEWYDEVTYEFYENDNVVSIVITYNMGYVAGSQIYEVYNFDIETGKLLKPLEVVNANVESENEISEDMLLKEISNLYMTKLYDKNIEANIDANVGNDGIVNTYKEMMTELVPKSADDIKVYRNENNELIIYTQVPNGAGQLGATHYTSINLFN